MKNAQAAFKASWGKYRADTYDKTVPEYIADLANSDWDTLATYYPGTVLKAAQRCAKQDATGKTMQADGSIGPSDKYPRNLMLRLVRERDMKAPSGVQCQYFDTGVPD